MQDIFIASAASFMNIAYAAAISEEEEIINRRPCLLRQRIDWDIHAQLLLDEGQFRIYYRMSSQSFENLLTIVGPALQIDEEMSKLRTGAPPISAVNHLQIGISWLAGYSDHPTRALAGVSKTSFYTFAWKTLDAIIASNNAYLKIQFPENDEEILKMADSFRSLSTNDVIRGCVGCIDGWLCPIDVPSKKEVAKVVSFYSGHYHDYGVNVQACVDDQCRFTAFASSCPGGMGDSIAFLRWRLSTIVKKIAERLLTEHKKAIYIIGDNAYTNSNFLITPFPKPKLTSPYTDSYNFHVSQVRIRVEMAFGLLVNKWRIFGSPLKIKMSNISRLLHAAFRLHNYCISMRLSEDSDYDVSADEDLVGAAVPVQNGNAGEDASPYSMMYVSSDTQTETPVKSEVVPYVEQHS